MNQRLLSVGAAVVAIVAAAPVPVSAAGPVAAATPASRIGTAFDCSVPVEQRSYLCASELVPAPNIVPDLRDQPCPQWVHDKYVAFAWQDARGEWRTRAATQADRASDNVVWRTWHPNRDPQTGCTFAHEHGWDWRGHAAMSGPPAFGLIGCLHWLSHDQHGDNHCAEPHEGFKAFRLDAGTYEWFEGARALHHSYYVLHFGTSGAGRLNRVHHSFQIWQKGARPGDPWRVHVMGMPSFGAAGNICDRDRGALNVRGDGGFRTLQEDPAQSTCADNSGYEIWFGKLSVRSAEASDPVFTIGASSAAFGPATMFRTEGGQRGVIPTGEMGCHREAYHEAGRYGVRDSGTNASYTDMRGEPMPPGTSGGALQVFMLPRERLDSGQAGIGAVALSARNDGERTHIFKLDEGRLTAGEPHGPGIHCYPTLQLPN